MVDATEQYRLFDFLVRGGWLMIPIALCSLIALAVIIERFLWGMRRSRVLPEHLRHEVQGLIQRNRLEEIVGLCRANNSPLARITLAAVQNFGRSKEKIVDALETAGKKEAARLQRYLGILGTIAAVAPLLGLLGTVFGMITTFAVMESVGVGNAKALAGGISEALITTASGLTVAIPSLIFHRFFLYKSRTLIMEMESIAAEILDEISSLDKEGNQVQTLHGVK